MTDGAIEGWVEWMEAGGSAPGTIYLKRRYVQRVADSHELVTVTRRQLVTWMARQDWEAETRKSAQGALRCCFAWMVREGLRPDNPTHGLPAVRVPPACPRPTVDAVYARALAGADEDVRLMVLLGALAGLRRAEIAGLHTSDLEDGQLRVKGKGGRMRLVPVDEHPELLAALQARPEGWVFPGRYPGTHTCADRVGRRLSAALGEGWSGHSLRARYGTRAFRGSRNLLAVQQLLGHSSPETTRRYVLVDEEALREAARAAA